MSIVIAEPDNTTIFFLNIHPISPPRSDICNAFISFFRNFLAQYGTSVQWAEPVTGSSKILAWGVKKRETKSQVFPGAVYHPQALHQTDRKH